MKRVWIAGNAGSGKTTLADMMGKKLEIPVYHIDDITCDKETGIERTEKEQIAITEEMAKKDKWIYDGSRFTASKVDGRFDRCDTIIYLNINRFVCLYRAVKRANEAEEQNNVPITERQPFSKELRKYILLEYPKKSLQRNEFFEAVKSKGAHVIVLKNKREVKDFFNNIELFL